jgi:nucleotide-binding universal stress UspA family protein
VPAAWLRAAHAADRLAWGRASGASTRRVRLGATARAVVAQARRPVVVVPQGQALGPPVHLASDGAPAARRALATASRIAAMTGGPLTGMGIADAPDVAPRLEAELDGRLQAQHLTGHDRQLLHPSAAGLAPARSTAGGGTRILSASSPLLAGEGFPPPPRRARLCGVPRALAAWGERSCDPGQAVERWSTS